MTKRIPESAWAAELHRFTSRNAGRRTKLELDMPDFSVNSPESAFPLRAIAYDAHGERVLITLGAQGAAARQLTHSIQHAHDIVVLIDARGRDEALAISHDDTQTLLRFLDL